MTPSQTAFLLKTLRRFFLHLPKIDSILYVSLENPDRHIEGVSRLLSRLKAPADQQLRLNGSVLCRAGCLSLCPARHLNTTWSSSGLLVQGSCVLKAFSVHCRIAFQEDLPIFSYINSIYVLFFTKW